MGITFILQLHLYCKFAMAMYIACYVRGLVNGLYWMLHGQLKSDTLCPLGGAVGVPAGIRFYRIGFSSILAPMVIIIFLQERS